ncbi:MAG: hypothetical protein QOE11_3754 [Solirubrobacteraceae bacterium]|nr:hypothetical protein [Solirubrobacteraceae bacterium]
MERSGVGRYAVESTRALCRARPEWSFALLSNRDLLAEGNARSVRTRWPTDRAWGRVGWTHAGSRWDLRADRFDCWIATAFITPLWWRGRSVVTIHDLMFLEHRALYAGRVRALYATLATRRSAVRADAIVCGSAQTRQRLCERWGIEPRRIAVTPYGVSDVFSRDAGGAGATGTRPFVLCVGTFEARKGLATLHGAMAQLNAGRRVPVELVLAGRPGWGADAAVERLRRDPNVSFRIDPSDETLAELYRTAVATVYPSQAEGFGLPVAEAMASGCAVVSSDLACVREFAGDAAVYVPAGDAGALARALARVVDDEQERRRLQDDGAARAARLTWASVGSAIADRIEAVL